MKFWKKGMAAFLSASMLATAFSGTALAAEDRTKITKIYLTVDSSITVGESDSDVTVSSTDSTYTIDDWEVTNDSGEWEAGDKPKIKVTLEADDDYYFSTTTSSAFKFYGDADVDSVSATRKNSNSTMVVTITLKALTGDLTIDSVEWDGTYSPIATWEEGQGAKSYQVRLYRGSSSVTEAFTTTNTYYNFSSYFTKTGEYYFRVRSVGSNSKKGEWVESDTMTIDETQLSRIQNGYYSTSNTSGTTSNGNGPGSNNAQSGYWLQDGIGWWYRNSDGSYTTNGWQYINNIWYCFDSAGYMRTGWILSNNVWYYCDLSTGAMWANATTPDGYRVDANGAWIK